jgi:uncharacterized protein (TIGR02284 family)
MENAKDMEKVIDVVNDLIRINQDRINGYEKAASEIKETLEAEIKSIYYQHAEESRGYKDTLTEAVARLGGKPATDSTVSGKIYRAWMDVKATFSGDDLVASLQSCEFGEDAALKAYREALDEKAAMPAGILSLIESQYQSLKASHNRIKRYRDEYTAAAKQ